MPGTVVGVASERDIVMLESDAAAADVLALLDERGVPGKQLHIFDDRTTVVISRENLHDEEQLRAALDSSGSAAAPRSSTAWPRSASSAPASTRPTERARGQRDAARSRHRAARHGDIVVPDHVDGSAGPDGRGGARAAPTLHRVG